jgi:hypothetical protein
MVGEDERAAVSLTRPNGGGVLVAHASRQRFADRQQQILAIANVASSAAPNDRRLVPDAPQLD